MKENAGAVLGIFTSFDELLAAIRGLRQRNIKVHTVYSPTPRHEIGAALGLEVLSGVRFFTLVGGVTGILAAIALVAYSASRWMLIVSGKPPIPTVPLVIVAFEFLILFSILFNIAGMLIYSRLPAARLPDHYDTRFSEDHFGILVRGSDGEKETVTEILKGAGAEEVHEVKG
jgi:hypothetical protein